jgi:thioredoxin 1
MDITLIIIGALVALFVGYSYFNFQKIKRLPAVADSEKIKVLTDKNFAHQINNGIMLVDFWAAWCMPCKMMAPILNEVADEVNSNSGVGKLNVEHYQSIAAKYNVRNIPTLILFKNGKEMDRFVGVKSKDFLLKKLKEI